MQWFIEEGLIDSTPTPTVVTQSELVDSGIVPEVMHAVEHDVDPAAAFEAAKEAYTVIEKGAANAYRKVENTMVDKLFRKEGETVEDTKERLRRQ